MKKTVLLIIIFSLCVCLVACSKGRNIFDIQKISKEIENMEEDNNEDISVEETNSDRTDAEETISNTVDMENPDEIGKSELEISEVEPVSEVHVPKMFNKWQTVKFSVKNTGKHTLTFTIYANANKVVDEYGELVDLEEPRRLPITQNKLCFEHETSVLPQWIIDYGIRFKDSSEASNVEKSAITYLKPNEERTYCVNLTFTSDPGRNYDKLAYGDFHIETRDFILNEKEAEEKYFPHISEGGDFSQELLGFEKKLTSVQAEYKIRNNTDYYIKKVCFIGENLNNRFSDQMDWTSYEFNSFKPGEEKKIESSLSVSMDYKGNAPELKDISIYIVDPKK